MNGFNAHQATDVTYVGCMAIQRPSALDELAGRFTLRVLTHAVGWGDEFYRGPDALRIDQDLGSHGHYAAIVPLPPRDHIDPNMVLAITEHALDQHFRPWLRPDPNPLPTIELFPRLNRFLERMGREIVYRRNSL